MFAPHRIWEQQRDFPHLWYARTVVLFDAAGKASEAHGVLDPDNNVQWLASRLWADEKLMRYWDSPYVPQKWKFY